MIFARRSFDTKNRSNAILSDRREALFFLNKYLFDIPEHVGRDSPRFAVIDTGWSDMPAVNDSNATKPSDKALARWPWSADKGKLALLS